MRISLLLTAAVVASPLGAQVTVYRANPGAVSRVFGRLADAPRVAIGITTTASATNRDTLGVLVSSVRPGSPAEKAGIEEGNRIASINGVSLRLATADVGEHEVANAMTHRLTRELEKLKAGDEVALRVYADGKVKEVKVKTIAPEELNDTHSVRRDDRATLGLSIGTTGGSRDSLGVFVMGVEDNGPAAKAGIEEGSRIASINGVDLRERNPADRNDFSFGASSVNRLERELGKVKPGDDVELRVYFNGQSRSVKVKSVRSSDLPRRGRSFTIMGGDNLVMPMPPMPPMPPMSPNAPQALRELLPRLGNRVVW